MLVDPGPEIDFLEIAGEERTDPSPGGNRFVGKFDADLIDRAGGFTLLVFHFSVLLFLRDGDSLKGALSFIYNFFKPCGSLSNAFSGFNQK